MIFPACKRKVVSIVHKEASDAAYWHLLQASKRPLETEDEQKVFRQLRNEYSLNTLSSYGR
jgi:hypothetical protein